MLRKNFLIGLMLSSLVACAGPPAPIPCKCDQLLQSYKEQAADYHQALLDKGMLREALKACQRRAE